MRLIHSMLLGAITLHRGLRLKSVIPLLVGVLFIVAVLSVTTGGVGSQPLSCAEAKHESTRHKRPLLIFILAGQSNMDGRSDKKDLPSELSKVQRDIRFFYRDTWTFLQPGSSWRVKQPELFGPEISFGRAMADRHPHNNFALVKHAKGGTSVAEEWDPNGGEHYQILFDRVRRATEELSREGVVWEVRGFVWMQGERDADFSHHAASYETNFAKFIGAVRRDLKQPDLPFVFGQIHAPTYKFRNHVREAQENVAREVRHTRMVRTDDLPMQQDQTHYTADGFVMLGRRFADALTELLGN